MASALPSPHPLHSVALLPPPLPMATGSTALSTDVRDSSSFAVLPHGIRRLSSNSAVSMSNTLSMEPESARCPIAEMEQSVLEFVNCMLMEEDKHSDTTTSCLLDHDDGSAVVGLYQNILKDFVDIISDHTAHGSSSVGITSYSARIRSSLPTDSQLRGDAGFNQNYIDASLTIDSLPVLHNEPNYLDQVRLLAMDGDMRQWPAGEALQLASLIGLADEEVSEIERDVDAHGSGSTTSDEIDAFHGERGSDSAPHLEFRREEEFESTSSDDSSVEFGVWVEQVLSSATLVNDDNDRNYLLPPAANSSTDFCTATSSAHSIHEVQQRPSSSAATQHYRSRSTDVEARVEQLQRAAVPVLQQTPLRERKIAAAGDRVPAAGFTEVMKAVPTMQLQLKMEQRDFSFKDEMGEVIQAEYENLYEGAYEDGSKKRGGGGGGGGGRRRPGANKRKGSASISAPGYFDLEELLLNCAQAVSRSDNKKAMEILQELKRQGASPQGRSCLHRMVFSFCRALEARLDGSGAALYAAEIEASRSNITAADNLRTWLRMFDSWHYIKICHFFANHSFMAVSEGRDRLHVVEYGFTYGSQWAYLIKALSRRAGGPPLLIVTGVQNKSSQKTPACTERWQPAADTGRRLSEFAAACNVPFRFYGVESSRWEDLDAESLGIELDRRSETTLVVNVIKHLQFIPDETIHEQLYGDPRLSRTNNHENMSPRQKLLWRIRSLRPDLFVTGVANAGFNVPTFLTRFKEALQHYSSMFDMMEVTTEESPERQLMERMFERAILNVVACEGADRMIRPETYRQWERRLHRAGWEQLPIPAQVLRRSMEYVKERYHRDCTVMEDHSSPWLVLGWRGRTYLAMSAWRPRF